MSIVSNTHGLKKALIVFCFLSSFSSFATEAKEERKYHCGPLFCPLSQGYNECTKSKSNPDLITSLIACAWFTAFTGIDTALNFVCPCYFGHNCLEKTKFIQCIKGSRCAPLVGHLKKPSVAAVVAEQPSGFTEEQEGGGIPPEDDE